MSKPVLSNDVIYKEAHPASENIHKLLCYARSNGIDWVPQSFGVSNDRHALSFIPGNVIHDSPKWIFNARTLKESARKLRAWHDATVGFQQVNDQWLLSNDEKHEVVCHNDFAPYNWVFSKHKRFLGLIDFDTCSPGSRLWDIAYTAYRIIPLMPCANKAIYTEISPFSYDRMIKRLKTFLREYAKGEPSIEFSPKEVIEKTQKRLLTIAEWSENEGRKTGNQELLAHASMYRLHADWLRKRPSI